MTATAALAGELGRHWPKRLARATGVPVDTARHWIYRGMPSGRRCEIAQAVRAECDRIEALVAETRRQWGLDEVGEAGGAAAGGLVDAAGAAAGRLGRPVRR